jgi:hypothetical protein
MCIDASDGEKTISDCEEFRYETIPQSLTSAIEIE